MLNKYLYTWPEEDLHMYKGWTKSKVSGFVEKKLPENTTDLSSDSRWPCFFPSAICFVTSTDGRRTALEKVVGAAIVNRFPYVVALSFCTESLSRRHYVRKNFMDILEEGKTVAIQYFEPGHCIDRLFESISTTDDAQIESRIEKAGFVTQQAVTNNCTVFGDAYLVYEARLVNPQIDHQGNGIFDKPYTDYGSHRIYYLEIEAIQLRKDIAHGETQINWKSLPVWTSQYELNEWKFENNTKPINVSYQKGYTSDYYFPAKNTIAFEYDKILGGRAIKYLKAHRINSYEDDNDKARWPCFFPSSLGMITTWGIDGLPNLMPCGSTSMMIRHPLCIGICVSYANLNIRYAPRASLDSLQKKGKFICGVPFAGENIINAIRYAGNISIREDNNKINNAGLQYQKDEYGPILTALPISYRCSIVEAVRLGTHFLFLGKIETILVREDVCRDNNIKWFPFPDIVKSKV